MKRFVLIILDGFGLSDDRSFNGIARAKTPMLDHFFETYPHTFLQASEEYVGLPKGQMGNSEIGHLTIGAGRILRQGLSEIDHAIETGAFQKHPELLSLIQQTSSKRCHLMGLFSKGGVHSHQSHFIKAAKILADAGMKVFLHIFTDGRDTSPKSALDFIKDIPTHHNIIPATLQGRFYAMDRDNRWDRTEKAYNAILWGRGKKALSFEEAISQSYENNVTDEFIEPYVIGDYNGVEDDDALFHINFRADRVRQLLGALILSDFNEFDRGERRIGWSTILGMSNYSDLLDLHIKMLYPSKTVSDGLSQILSQNGKKILKVAETEKYAHVTFFFNGGHEEPVEGEDRILIPSPKVATYDLAPEMSASKVTQAVCDGMAKNMYDLIVVNFANPDMVGHTGVQDAIIQSIECIDQCLKRIDEAAQKEGYNLMITADHGNAECMVDHEKENKDDNDDDGVLTDVHKPHTAHTCNPVPLIIVDYSLNSSHNQILQPGTLADIAPTLLKAMNVNIPKTMTGKILIESEPQ